MHAGAQRGGSVFRHARPAPNSPVDTMCKCSRAKGEMGNAQILAGELVSKRVQ